MQAIRRVSTWILTVINRNVISNLQLTLVLPSEHVPCARVYASKFRGRVSHRGSIKAQCTGLICLFFPKSIFIPFTARLAACSGLLNPPLPYSSLMLQNHICMCRVCVSQRTESFQFEVSWNVLIGTQVNKGNKGMCLQYAVFPCFTCACILNVFGVWVCGYSVGISLRNN